MVERVHLEPEDRKLIRQHLFPVLLFPVFAFIMFAVVGNSFGSGFITSLSDSDVTLYVFGGFGLFFLGIIGYAVSRFALDLQRGEKLKVSGVVTDKHLDISRSSSGGKRSTSKTSRTYSLFIEGYKYKVGLKAYQQAKVGQEVLLEQAPKSKLVLNFSLSQTENDAVVAEEKREVNQEFLNTVLTPEPLTEEDLRAIKIQWNSKLRGRFGWVAVAVFFMVSLFSSGLYILYLFSLPFWIILITQAFRLSKDWRRMQANRKAGTKQGKTELVKDKRSTATNGRNRTCQLVFPSGMLRVPPDLYEAVTKDSRLVVYYLSDGTTPICILTLDKKVHYLQ
ncbi:MAG: hypothetical protein AAFQ98_01070 [Bacteroidota bacterium]